MVNAPQAVLKIVRNGGTRTPKQIKAQWEYISKNGDIELKRPESAHGVPLARHEWNAASREWAEATGRYAVGQQGPSDIDLTTHIVVSFPPGTNTRDAQGAGREWAERMFRPLDHGEDMDDDVPQLQDGQHAAPQNYNYITAFHTDREHPHLHIVVNRRGSAGGWLKISRRHPVMNYNNMRQELVEAAANHNIVLEATSRAERGIDDPAPTDAELRRRARVPIPIYPLDQTNRSVNSDSEGDISYASDSDVDYDDFDHSVGDAPSGSNGGNGGGGNGGGGAQSNSVGPRRNAGQATGGSGLPDGQATGVPAEITIHPGNADTDMDDDYEQRKPAAKTREELEAERQRRLANPYEDSSDPNDNQIVVDDDEDYQPGVARMPRHAREAAAAEQAKIAQQEAKRARNLADAARWRAENAQQPAGDVPQNADETVTAAGHQQTAEEMQGVEDQAATRKRKGEDLPERTSVLGSDDQHEMLMSEAEKLEQQMLQHEGENFEEEFDQLEQQEEQSKREREQREDEPLLQELEQLEQELDQILTDAPITVPPTGALDDTNATINPLDNADDTDESVGSQRSNAGGGKRKKVDQVTGGPGLQDGALQAAAAEITNQSSDGDANMQSAAVDNDDQRKSAAKTPAELEAERQRLNREAVLQNLEQLQQRTEELRLKDELLGQKLAQLQQQEEQAARANDVLLQKLERLSQKLQASSPTGQAVASPTGRGYYTDASINQPANTLDTDDSIGAQESDAGGGKRRKANQATGSSGLQDEALQGASTEIINQPSADDANIQTPFEVEAERQRLLANLEKQSKRTQEMLTRTAELNEENHKTLEGNIEQLMQRYEQSGIKEDLLLQKLAQLQQDEEQSKKQNDVLLQKLERLSQKLQASSPTDSATQSPTGGLDDTNVSINQSDKASDIAQRKPAAKTPAELEAERQRLLANSSNDSSDDIDDQDYTAGIARQPRYVRDANLIAQASIAEQKAKTARILADAARRRSEITPEPANDFPQDADGSKTALGRAAAVVAPQGDQGGESSAATQKRKRGDEPERESVEAGMLLRSGRRVVIHDPSNAGNTNPAAPREDTTQSVHAEKRVRREQEPSDTAGTPSQSESDNSPSNNQEMETNQTKRKRDQQSAAGRPQDDTDNTLNQGDQNNPSNRDSQSNRNDRNKGNGNRGRQI